ncbi:MAG: ComEC/Rec2 family competence protein [Spirochaetota bacterium]
MSALVPSAAAATVGILWAASGAQLPFLLIIAVAACGLAVCGFPRFGARRQRAGGVIAICAGAVILGAGSQVAGELSTRARLPVEPSEVRRAEGTLLAVGGEADRPIATVRLASAASEWVDGEARGELLVIAATPGRPAVGTRVALTLEPGGSSIWRDDAGRLWARATITTVSPGTAPGEGDPGWATGARRMRDAIALAVDEIAGDAAPLVRALLVGDAALIDPRVRLLFRRSGVMHLLALSGMHLAVIALLVRSSAGLLVGRRAAAWLAVGAGFAYVALAGPRPGLVRAALLVLFATSASARDRPRPLVELLCACFLVQVLLQPEASGSLGFQLSYLSLLGIAAVARPFAEAIRPWIPPAVSGPLGAGVGAGLATAPLVLAFFGAWYPVGIVASIAIGPVVLLVMVVGLVAVAISLAGVGWVAVVARPVLELLNRTVEGGVWFFSAAPAIGAGDGTSRSVVVASTVGTLAVVAGLVWQARAGAAGRVAAARRRTESPR